MKKILVVLVLLGASTSFACPDLSGTYSCPADDSTEQMTYTQSEKDGVTTYVVSDAQGRTELIADGKIHGDSNLLST